MNPNPWISPNHKLSNKLTFPGFDKMQSELGLLHRGCSTDAYFFT